MNDWGKFRKKPVVVEARMLTEDQLVGTAEGVMHGRTGDWLIRGVEGELYPCKDSVFRRTYEAVDD